jgi:DNA-binding XRE family transcriptional regulator
MGDEKSSAALCLPVEIRLHIEWQLPTGEVMELSGSEFRDELGPLLDSHLVDAKCASDGDLGFEVSNSVGFGHPPSISMAYLEYKTELQPSSYAEEMETMGDRIKMLRQSKGWTQTDLGEQVGVSKVAVYQWEKGITSDIKLRTFQKLVEVLGTNSHYLLFGPEAPRSQPRKRSQS